MNIPDSRKLSFLIITIVYLLAIVVGIVTYVLVWPYMLPIWALLVADVAATLLTWAAGLLYKNVSVYDPYWSVAPPVLLTAYACLMPRVTLAGCLLLLGVWIWAIRLTANWAVTFKGLQHEDWRYSKYRSSQPRFIFEIINLFGLNLMPTFVVFFAMVPGIYLLERVADVTIFSFVGALMCFAAAVIQHLADTTSHRFRREHPGQICRVGLWKHGRHPNYFGEILMWWGVWMQWLGCSFDWTIVGPLAITALFLGISIPLMESRQIKNKPGYADYRKETRILI